MGIYDKGLGFGFQSAFARSKKPLQLGVIVLAVLLIGWLAVTVLSVQPIGFSFKKNPITNSEQTILNVSITNTTGSTARDVPVEVFAEDKKSISVAPPIKTIDILDNFRELEFVINPVGNALPGDYVLNIKTKINGKEFAKQAILSIEKKA